LRVLLVGYGRMGRAIDALCAEQGVDVCGRLDDINNADGRAVAAVASGDVAVAIDFTTAEAVRQNVPALAARGINMVIGTTGWQAHEAELRQVALDAGIGVVAAPNFSLGAALFAALVERAGALFASQREYGAWIHETHHAAKRDAPSGTALALRSMLERAGYGSPIDVSSTRVGYVPGTHVVGFDGRFDTVTLTHSVRDRGVFAVGALQAAHWVRGRRGWFGIADVLGLGTRD
jgi:4-hydroxy-tetrahydrodipicolinate reductase